MSFSVVIAPTKSLGRNNVGRSCVAIQRQQRLRQRHMFHFESRRKSIPESIAVRKGKYGKSLFHSRSAGQQNRPLSLSTSPRKLHRLSGITSISTCTASSRTIHVSCDKDNKNTAMVVTIAMATIAVLLRETYQREHHRKFLEQKNRMKDEKDPLSVILEPQLAAKRAEIMAKKLPLLSSAILSPHKSLLPLSYYDHDDPGFLETERLKDRRQKLLGDFIWGVISAIAPSSDAISSSAEPLRRQAVKNPISSQFHQPRNVMISRMRSVAGRGMHEKYKVDWNTVLGEGAYGSVHPARLALTGEKVALKKISKRYTNSSDFFSETDALLQIYDNGGHPNISGLRDMYEDYKHYYLVMDLITGGELFDHLSNDGAYSEADAARLIFEISSALAFMHGVGVIHCDIKPENLMLCSRKRRGGTIKIIDFGCAITQPVGHFDSADDGNGNINTNGGSNSDGLVETGTTGYWPPERFKGHKLTPAVDTWALGIILYIMLMGFHPFDINCDRSDEEVAAAIQSNPLPPMDDVYVGHLSDSAKDLIRRLMEPDPKKRMSAYELLHHPWVEGETATTEKIEDSDKRLSKFQDLRYKLEASVFAVLVNQGHPTLTMSEAKRRNTVTKNGSSGVSTMKSVFDVFDEDGKGYVTGEDIGKVVTEHTGEVLKTHDANEFLKVGNQESELSLSNFSNLFSGMKHKHFPRGHYIFHAGDEGRSMYFLSSGKVEVQTRKGQLVAILRNGDFFGEGSLLDENKKRFTTAKCATPVDVIEINREDFDRYTRTTIDTKNELKRKWRARSLVYAKNLLRFEQSLKARTLSKGDVVYYEGDKGTAMYRVDDLRGGELEVLHGDVPVHKYAAGDSFGESSLLFDKPRSSTVRCISDECHIHEMSGDDFMAVIQSSPDSADSLRNMCRKRLFKRAVKQFSLETNRGLSDDDIVAAFHNADEDNSGYLNVEDVRKIMHRMDPKFPISEIHQLMKFVDVNEDGQVDLHEFKQIFRQFEDEKA